MNPAEYAHLDRHELETRLAAAETACIYYGWSATSDSTAGKAAYMAWSAWLELVPDEMLKPTAKTKKEMKRLAAERDELRRRTLSMIGITA
jgi:glutathione S-transferase